MALDLAASASYFITSLSSSTMSAFNFSIFFEAIDSSFFSSFSESLEEAVTAEAVAVASPALNYTW